MNSYLEHNAFVLFSDSVCPFCRHTQDFVDALRIEHESIALDGFGNRQLIQNYVQRLCGDNVAARCPPVAFVKSRADDAKRVFLIGADGICEAWQTRQLHDFYPHLLTPHGENEAYDGQWRRITQIQANMTSSFGYKPAAMSAYLSAHEPHPGKIKKWAQFVGTPILAKDVGNPQRPTG